MNSSSQQPSCLTISQLDAINNSGTVSITSSTGIDTINLNEYSYDSSYFANSGDTITISNLTASSPIYTTTYSTINTVNNIQSIDVSNISGFFINQEWKNTFPDFTRIQKMCDMYPGLKIAFEKFKTTYNLVKDDYDAPPEKRIKP